MRKYRQNTDKIQIKYRQKYRKIIKEIGSEREVQIGSRGQWHGKKKKEYIDSIHKSTKTRDKYEQLDKAGSQRKIIFKN